jgi:divalent metal cation (Fe/Co/Zn/Cd) transporter
MRPYAPEPMDAVRLRLTKAAVRACGASVIWAAAVGVAAVAAGVASRSIALVAFGLDSVVDGSASAALVWRFGAERRSSDRAEHVEAFALRLIRAALLLAAAYVSVQAIWNLATRSRPMVGGVGIVLSGTSVVVLSVLAWVKLRLARQLESHALRGDGILSAAGATLAIAALLGLLLAHALDWWWADSIAALAISGALAAEGIRNGIAQV